MNLDEIYAKAALKGLLAGRPIILRVSSDGGTEEEYDWKDYLPDPKWACRWSFGMGRRMAIEARRRRARKSRSSF